MRGRAPCGQSRTMRAFFLLALRFVVRALRLPMRFVAGLALSGAAFFVVRRLIVDFFVFGMIGPPIDESVRQYMSTTARKVQP
jgi:hypothetical protein